MLSPKASPIAVVYLYPIALAIISAVVMALEFLFPWRKDQKQLRRAFPSDIIHLIFNGHFLGVVLFAISARWIMPEVDRWAPWLNRAIAADWPMWLQFVVAVFVIDFVHWCIHNTLHRVPALWELHKTHHSVVDGEMDWIVSFRFQWTEVVYYKSVTHIPLAFFGFGGEAIMFHAIFGTLIGHLNHSNLNLTWGPGRYLLNSPRMHIWHHDYSGDAKTTVNFGIIFSCWDWIFRTAKMPEGAPAKLGFPGVEKFPTDFFAQAAWPVSGWMQRAPRLASSMLGAAIIGLGLLISLGGCAKETPPVIFGEEARLAGFARPQYMISGKELAAAHGNTPDLLIIDARDRQKFELAHIPGAVSLPLGELIVKEPIAGLTKTPAELEKVLRSRGVRNNSKLVVYAEGGPEAHRVWWALKSVAGLEARVLDGGLNAWRAAGKKAVSGAPDPIAKEGDVSLANAKEPPLLWKELQPENAENALILDVRTADEFSGKTKHADSKKAGHIPGSKHLHWIDLLESPTQPNLKKPAELRALFAAQGVTEDTRVITTCQAGARAAVAHFALLQIGMRDDKVAVYNGGWTEYSGLELPIEATATATP